jgi:hypothetical protein
MTTETTIQRDRATAAMAVYGLCHAASQCMALSCGTEAALDAVTRVGAAHDYREIELADLREVCRQILAGHVRADGCDWSAAPAPIMARLARLAMRWE